MKGWKGLTLYVLEGGTIHHTQSYTNDKAYKDNPKIACQRVAIQTKNMLLTHEYMNLKTTMNTLGLKQTKIVANITFCCTKTPPKPEN